MAIFDPVRNRYFRISWVAFELISRWHSGTEVALLSATQEETTCPVQMEDVRALLQFLESSQLTQQSLSADDSQTLPEKDASLSGRLRWFLQNYLFLRIPLFRPDAFFQKIMPWVSPLFSPLLRNVLLVVGVVALFLVSRQWEAFSTTFLYFYSPGGFVFFLLGIVFVKICHELGHALTATRYGCRVASMGVAFLVFFPVLYTDTTDAYRLTSRRKRLYVSAAGILTEFYIALICLFLWSLLPDGVLRSVVFVLGTVSFTLTVLINLNPFLRFDGYYFLADALGMENLQDRAFAMGRWKLRQLLLGLKHEPPEHHDPTMARFLIGFAWATWLYRLFLLFAIASIVYYFFFKLLGLLLFAGVVYTFILTPVVKELAVWRREKAAINLPHRVGLAALCLAVLLLLMVPWRSSIGIQVVAEPAVRATVFTPAPGQVVQVHAGHGDQVLAGDVIVTLESDRLNEELRLNEIRQEILQYRLQRIAASAEDRQASQVLLQQLRENESRITALRELAAQLVLRSPIDGTIVEMEDSLYPGRWINTSLPIAYVTGSDDTLMHGYVAEQDLARLAPDQVARFVPDQLTSPTADARVVSISESNVSALDRLYQASVFGGDVAVRRDDDGELVPESAVYRVALQPAGEMSIERVTRGVVQIEGEPRSLLRRVYEVIAAAFIRGTAF